MTNKEVVSVLEEIAMLLDLSGESSFKGRAYTTVARRIEQMEGDVAALSQDGRGFQNLGSIPARVELEVGSNQPQCSHDSIATALRACDCPRSCRHRGVFPSTRGRDPMYAERESLSIDTPSIFHAAT